MTNTVPPRRWRLISSRGASSVLKTPLSGAKTASYYAGIGRKGGEKERERERERGGGGGQSNDLNTT